MQYLSNICQVMDDSSLPVENDGVVGDLFVEVEERKKRCDVKIKGALLKMTANTQTSMQRVSYTRVLVCLRRSSLPATRLYTDNRMQ